MYEQKMFNIVIVFVKRNEGIDLNFFIMETKFRFLQIFLLAGIFSIAACNDDDDVVEMPDASNIIEVAQQAGQFNILIEAAQRTGLDGFLSTENNITVFAPTDQAFVNLLAELNLSGLDDLDNETLANILKYHVIGSKAMSSSLSTGYYPTLSTFSDNNLSMYINVEGGVYINKSTMVTAADIPAENGVIHVVDKVIMPPSVVNIALDNDNFSILVEAVVKAGLVDALSASGPFTVFAPTNQAFQALFSELGVMGIADLTAADLTPILTYHVVSGNVLSTDLSDGEVGTLNTNKKLMIDLSSGVKINESSVVAADIQGANGVVHVINKVLIP